MDIDVDARMAVVLGAHGLVALAFVGLALANLLGGEPVGALLQAAMAALVVGLGVTVSRIL